MIILYNPNTTNPFSVQYVNSEQVFRKEILPNHLVGFRHLTGATQIVNSQALINEGVSIFDPINNIVTNLGSYTTGYTGFIVHSGLTITKTLVTTPTGYTFITSASTGTTLANNTASSVAVGNSGYTEFSGSVSTLAWFNSVFTATAFSGYGITVSGQSALVSATGDTTIIFSISSSTFSSNVANTLFVDNNVKRENYLTASAFSNNTAFTTLNGFVLSGN